MIKTLIAFAALASSASTFATGWHSHGKLQVNEDSVRFVGKKCDDGNSLVSFNDDGSFDLIFDDLSLDSAGERVSTTCQFKFDGHVPAGWTVTANRVGIAGTTTITDYEGTSVATLRHTLAGQVSEAAIASYAYNPHQETQDVVLDYVFPVSAWNKCGGDLTFKTSIALTAKGANSFINITEGAVQPGKVNHKKYVRYYWSWKKC